MIRNCPKCGKIFHFIHSPICDDCIKLDQDTFEKVRQHLKENPGISLMGLAKETDVDSKKILRYIKEGKLELLTPEAECEKCKAKISTGRFCPQCVDEMGKNAFEAVAKFRAENELKKGTKMFTDRGRT